MKKYHKQASGQHVGDWVQCRAKNCRLTDLTESEMHQAKNREHLTTLRSNATDLETVLKVSTLEAAMNSEYTPVSSYGHPLAVASLEEDKAAAAAVIASGDREAMENFIQSRIDADAFTELLNKRDANLALLEELSTQRKTLKEAWEADSELYYEDVRQKELAEIDVNEEISILRRQINEYKDVHAPVIAAAAEIDEQELRAAGNWAEYDEETLNNLTKTAYYPSGTREWLEQRQQGVGGSDVGGIMGIKGAYNSREEIMASKLEPISEEQVAEQAQNNIEYSGATGRGNAWEQRIFMQVKENNPDKNITFCKTSWENNDNKFQKANFDGLMADENGHPDGIVEIKTASDASKWGNTEDGLAAVPATYRAQALWYAQAAGFKRGMVAVVIDDREYREYHFNMTPELEAEAADNLAGSQKFMTEMESRKNGTWVNPRTRRTGFAKEATNSSLLNKPKQALFQEVAYMRGVNKREVQREFLRGFDKTRAKEPEYVSSRLRNLYVETAKQETLPDYIGIDLETAGSQPQSGQIIELGASIRSNYRNSTLTRQDTETGKISKLYGLSRKSLLARGTGNQDVHGISTTQIAKKRQFSNPEESASIMRKFLSVGLLVAHNKQFEERWLSTHLPGFADAKKRGRIRVIDTRKLSERLLPDVPNDKLESFTARYNVPYTGAHRAYNDAEMMSYAYERMLRELRTGQKEL